MYSITKIVSFSAAHALALPGADPEQNAEAFGECARIHGHSYRLEVTLSGEELNQSGMLLDAREIKNIVERVVVQDLDHTLLNRDVPWLEGLVPSCEVLTREIFNRLKPEFQAISGTIFLSRVRLWETDSICAEYAEEKRGVL